LELTTKTKWVPSPCAFLFQIWT